VTQNKTETKFLYIGLGNCDINFFIFCQPKSKISKFSSLNLTFPKFWTNLKEAEILPETLKIIKSTKEI